MPEPDPAEAQDLLRRLTVLNNAIRSERAQLRAAESAAKEHRRALASHERDRDKLLDEIANPPRLPLLGHPGASQPHPGCADDAEDDGPADLDAELAGYCAEVEAGQGHKHARECYDDAGPGAGGVSLICGEPDVLTAIEAMPEAPPIACTRCGLGRPGREHPCPGCGCPEFALREPVVEAPRPRRGRKGVGA